MQPTSTDVEVFIEGLLQPPNELAVLYPGCSPESRVVVDIAESSLFNVTVVSSLGHIATCMTYIHSTYI